jgi:tRNA(Arg) A34 adenosine deaminase TadA
MVVPRAVAFSAAHYFGLLLERAERAERAGNYAIAAALVTRQSGREVIVHGANTMFQRHNPAGHAEMDAILTARDIGLAGPSDRAGTFRTLVERGEVILRPAPDMGRECVLYTTLEPCPMCTVCLLNSGVERVVIAVEDPIAGSLSPDRLRSLPSLWTEFATSLDIQWGQTDNPDDPSTYVPPDLRAALVETFMRSRVALDSVLDANGVLDLRALHAVAAAYAAGADEGRTAVP